MILPVYVYGSPVLKKIAEPVTTFDDELKTLIADMFETMYSADGVGLAAPQVGKSVRLVVIDASVFAEDDPISDGFKRVLINPEFVEFSEEQSMFNEGCLSLPKLHEDVKRPVKVRVKYVNENFEGCDEWWEGMPARIVQHEVDHLNGILFVDHLAPIRKKLISSRLQKFIKGAFTTSYRTKIG